MYKYGVGQEVIFKDVIAPKTKYGVITGGISSFVNNNIETTYTIKSGGHYYANVKEEDIQERAKKLESQRVYNYDFSNDVSDWTSETLSNCKGFIKQKRVDETIERIKNYGLDLSTGKNLETKSNFEPIFYKRYFDEKKVGLPHSVHFKYKRNRTTLVWKVKSIFGKETYSTTTSEAHEEKFDRLYGFLMAYFKKVHEHKSKTWRKKYLEKNVYTLKHKEQINFLTTIFAQNCGLETEKVYEYLKEIVKDKE